MGQEKYEDCIKDSCQTNLDESSHTIDKIRKSSEMVEFEDELHIEIKIELVQKVDEAGSFIKDKDYLINQLFKKIE